MKKLVLAMPLLLGMCSTFKEVTDYCPAPPFDLTEPAASEITGPDPKQQARQALSAERAGLHWKEVDKRAALVAWGREHCGWH